MELCACLQAAAGTWNGPAPKGELTKEQHGSAVQPMAPNIPTRPLPRDVRLGFARMPLLLLQPDAQDAESMVQSALQAGVRGLVMHTGNAASVGAGLKKWSGARADMFIVAKVRARHSCMLSTHPLYLVNFKACMCHRCDLMPQFATPIVLWLALEPLPRLLQVSASDADGLHNAVQTVLQDSKCGHIDVLLISASAASLSAAWSAAESLVAPGGVKQLGVADGTLEAVEELAQSADVKPVCNLVELHPMHSQRRLVGTLMRKVHL